jgi:ATP-dependent Lhr-like helicase
VSGSSKRRGRVVDPRGARTVPELVIDYVATPENAARAIQLLHPNKKRLVLVESRRGAEELGKQLGDLGVTAFVTHGSLSAPERRDAECAFETGRDCAIVATSALELGVDLGDLDHALQIDAPSTVASFLQRIGRTGRCAETKTTAGSCARRSRWSCRRRHWFGSTASASSRPCVRRVVPRTSSRTRSWRAASSRAASGSAIGGPGSKVRHLLPSVGVLRHMLDAQILADQGGRLWLGPEGERRYGRAGFRKLYAVFEAPWMITVRVDAHEVGTVDAQFLGTLDSGPEPGSFVLAGKPWRVVTIDWDRVGLLDARPSTPISNLHGPLGVSDRSDSARAPHNP